MRMRSTVLALLKILLNMLVFEGVIWPYILIIMIIKCLFSGILFICIVVASFATLAFRARAANDTTYI